VTSDPTRVKTVHGMTPDAVVDNSHDGLLAVDLRRLSGFDCGTDDRFNRNDLGAEAALMGGGSQRVDAPAGPPAAPARNSAR